MRRRFLTVVAFFAIAASAFAQRVTDLNGRHIQFYPPNDRIPGAAGRGGGGQNLSFHGGPVMTGSVKIVAIFWGGEWTGSGATTQSQVVGFFSNFGTTGEYGTIAQYYDANGTHISSGALATTAYNDTSAPPTNATDSDVQAAVSRYITNHQGGNADASTIYEVFLPSTSYASYGSSDSCGGPNLSFCAYHSNFNYGGTRGGGVNVKYSSMPYPSCSGCSWSGWTDAQNLDHFACHETREAVTDPDGTAWYDRRGNEADDKCAWSPAPFLDGGFGYQYEWSNAVQGCITGK